MEVLQSIRDVAIVILAIETIVVGAATLVLMWQLWKLVSLAKGYAEHFGGSAKEILGTVQQTTESAAKTTRHAQGTVEFIANRTALPVIEAYSVMSGASRFARSIFRKSKTKPREGS